jgi:mannose-6-phosphate isomerase-like protein (cupin superfamily)
MEIINIAKERNYAANGINICYGTENFDKKPSELSTLIYSATPGLLLVEDKEILLPPRSVTVVRPGIEAKIITTPQEKELPNIIFRVPIDTPHIDPIQAQQLQKPYEINRSEWNSSIIEHLDGKVTFYPEHSRYVVALLKNGKAVKSVWYTTCFKGQPFSISDAVWTVPRVDEVVHEHRIIQESYIILDGTAKMYINGEILPVPKGSLALTALGEAHKVESVLTGNTGEYYHICTNYPSITGDAGERRNVDQKKGFNINN